MQLTQLSDEALVSQLAAVCLEGHRLTARLVVYLIEVEARRLDLKAACTSMFDFCVRRLGMSEGAAFRRINAARLVKRFPALLARIESGELHLSTLVLLRPHLMHLTDAKAADLAASVAGKTQREVEELLARRAPRPDVVSSIVELPRAPYAQVELGSQGEPAMSAPALKTAPARIEPLSETRFKVQLTASAELREKLERARDLMSHANRSGDLAVVVEKALDLLLDHLEKQRLGKVTRPTRHAGATPRVDRPRTSRARSAIPRAVRREVFERDGGTCTFVDTEGRRCPSRAHLELDHILSRALGGSDEASNLRVRCRAHNRLHAEEVFGKEHVARAVDFRQRKSRCVESVEAPASRVDEAAEEARTVGTAIDVALRGLVSLGFARSDARRALDAVARRRNARAEALPVQEVLREAIAALT
ncbi:MAG: hypothetical protein JWO86_677 [Myxococcaceae bacterium]|nr:hypothetical protein [Myxococcaceae bacterium]